MEIIRRPSRIDTGLVLRRRLYEKAIIRIGDNKLVVTVTEINGTDVKLGFKGSQEFKIIRSELENG